MLLNTSGPQFPHLENRDDNLTVVKMRWMGICNQLKAAWHSGKAESRRLVMIIFCLCAGQQGASRAPQLKQRC